MLFDPRDVALVVTSRNSRLHAGILQTKLEREHHDRVDEPTTVHDPRRQAFRPAEARSATRVHPQVLESVQLRPDDSRRPTDLFQVLELEDELVDDVCLRRRITGPGLASRARILPEEVASFAAGHA